MYRRTGWSEMANKGATMPELAASCRTFEQNKHFSVELSGDACPGVFACSVMDIPGSNSEGFF